jgi:hypothetical protein
MKQCPRCARELPESAMACGHCDDQTVAVEAISATSARVVGSTPPPATTPSPALAGLSRRELATILIAVVGGGTLTLAMLMASGDPKPEAASAPADAGMTDRAAPASTASSTSAPKWRAANLDWVGNHRKAVAFELPAENKVPIWQRHAHPILVVRCFSNQTEVFVYIESAAKMEPQDDNHTIRLALDAEPEITERWADSPQHDALFSPDGAMLARRLLGARTMRFGYTPHNANRVVADFHVSGLAQLLEPVAKQCGLGK